MSDTPRVITPPPLPGGRNRFQDMARASWLAPLIATAVNLAIVSSQTGKPNGLNPVLVILGPLFIIGGLTLGTIALFGIRKHGTRKILAPALVGIGINVFLTVMAALPLSHPAKKRAHLQPAVHSPSARLLKDDRLRFSMDIPAGFKDFPEGKRTPNVEYVFTKEIPDAGQARMVITIERLNGTLPKNQPIPLAEIRKRMSPGFNIEPVDKNWRGLRVDAIVAAGPQNGIRMVICTIQIPLVPSAIQLAVVGPESNRAEVEQIADALLASLEGDTNW